MNVLADQHLYKIRELIPQGVEVSLFDPENGLPGETPGFDALLIRTVTKINPQTLPRAGNLKFIGTATAGTDHLDTEHIEQLGIRWANSKGCNAQAVAEYVVTGLYKWAKEKHEDAVQKKIGIVGCGAAGGSVLKLLQKLGCQTVAYDPPKAGREPEFHSAPLDELLSCDVLTFHTPLTRDGTYPTFHLCDNTWLARGFDLIINSARGGVVKETDLVGALNSGQVRDFILDVWEGEPVFSDGMARNAFIATPHIAGYSREAKWRASEMIVQQMCEFFGIPAPSVESPGQYDPGDLISKDLSFAGFLWKNHKIDLYDRELRKLIGLENHRKSAGFAKLRSETETRFEFGTIIRSIGGNIAIPQECSVFSGK